MGRRPLFTTLVADCPWPYKDKLSKMGPNVGARQGAASQYKTMAIKDIEDFLATERLDGRPLDWALADDGFLFLWITNPLLLDGTGVAVCRAWGYEPKQLVTWVKGDLRLDYEDDDINGDDPSPVLSLACGLGRYTRGATEHMILGTRGRATRLVKAKNVRNVLVAPAGRHSEKPDAAYALIEAVAPGPYLELFARKTRPGWTVMGDEVAP